MIEGSRIVWINPDIEDLYNHLVGTIEQANEEFRRCMAPIGHRLQPDEIARRVDFHRRSLEPMLREAAALRSRYTTFATTVPAGPAIALE